MRFVFRAAKVHHAVEAGKGRASTLVPMRVELLFRQDIAAILQQIGPVSDVLPNIATSGMEG